jgi:hypothetical protein
MFRGVGYLSGKSKSAPSLNLDFLLGGLDSRITFMRASNAWYFNGAGNLVQASTNEPRFDYDPATLQARGLLIEGSRTNGVRNPRFEGAVAGTPGTDPTLMFFGADVTGLSRQIVATGTDSGLPYIDVRWFGTTTAAGRLQWFMDGGGAIAASIGQSFTMSHFYKIISGTFPVANGVYAFAELDSVNTVLAQILVASGAPYSSDTRLTAARRFATATITNASTTFLRPVWFSDIINSGVAVDVTIRFAAPQTESESFPTSPIFPAVGSLAASTRATDFASMTPVTPWFNAAEGTLLLEASFPYFPTFNGTILGQEIFRLDDGTSNNAMVIRLVRNTGSNNYFDATASAGGVGILDSTNYSFSPGQIYRFALAYNATQFATSFNGSAVTTAATTSLPIGINRLRIGAENGAANIRRLAYYPMRLSNTTLQGLTA